jgi:hypothetical protein
MAPRGRDIGRQYASPYITRCQEVFVIRCLNGKFVRWLVSGTARLSTAERQLQTCSTIGFMASSTPSRIGAVA